MLENTDLDSNGSGLKSTLVTHPVTWDFRCSYSIMHTMALMKITGMDI